MEQFQIPTELLLHVPVLSLLERVLRQKADMGEQQAILITSAVSAALTYLYRYEKSLVNTEDSGSELLYNVVVGLLTASGGHFATDLTPQLLA